MKTLRRVKKQCDRLVFVSRCFFYTKIAGNRNFEGGKWDIPGGKVEALETPQEAAIRETEEEIGLNVQVKGVIFENSNFDTEKKQVFTTLVYLCDSENNGRMKLNLEEHDEYKWSAPEDILDMKEEELVPYMKGMILAFKRMKAY